MPEMILKPIEVKKEELKNINGEVIRVRWTIEADPQTIRGNDAIRVMDNAMNIINYSDYEREVGA